MFLIRNSIVGITLIIFGLVLKFWPPKNINSSLGYRTPFSMRSKETWKEGNLFASKMLLLSGIISLCISSIVTFTLKDMEAASLALSSGISLFITIILVFGFTEIHLRRLFDKTGKRKI